MIIDFNVDSDELRLAGLLGKVSGTINVPGDKSISHRALLIGALASGQSTITGLSAGEDVAETLTAVRSLGATVSTGETGVISVVGGDLHEPLEPIYMGNSGTGLRLLMGVCAGIEGMSVLTGDSSLNNRPIDRIAGPLTQMGASVKGRNSSTNPPVVVCGKKQLKAIDYQSPIASAQLKSAILFAGLNADGPSTVTEPVVSRPHTEEMFVEAGISVSCAGTAVTIEPGQPKPLTDFLVPGDPSQAAFWVCLAAALPGASVTVENVYSNPLRTRFVEVLKRMGANVEMDSEAKTIRVTGALLAGTTIEGDEVVSVIDEIPALAMAAAISQGKTVVKDAHELRVKESDRIAAIESEFAKFGVSIVSTSDGFTLEGLMPGGVSQAGPAVEQGDVVSVDSHMDHRIAMASSLLGVALGRDTTVSGWSTVMSSYPNFAKTLESLAK